MNVVELSAAVVTGVISLCGSSPRYTALAGLSLISCQIQLKENYTATTHVVFHCFISKKKTSKHFSSITQTASVGEVVKLSARKPIECSSRKHI